MSETTDEELEKLKEEREKVAHNTKVEAAFCFVYLACLIAKRWWLKLKKTLTLICVRGFLLLVFYFYTLHSAIVCF